MRQVLVNVWRARDRVFVLLSFLGFGVWSVIAPTPSLAALPDVAEFATYGEFILASFLLVYGSSQNAFLTYLAGHVLLIIGLLTVAGVVVATSGSPVAVLIFGYGCGIAVSLQNTLRERKLLAEVKAEMDENTQPDIPITRPEED